MNPRTGHRTLARRSAEGIHPTNGRARPCPSFVRPKPATKMQLGEGRQGRPVLRLPHGQRQPHVPPISLLLRRSGGRRKIVQFPRLLTFFRAGERINLRSSGGLDLHQGRRSDSHLPKRGALPETWRADGGAQVVGGGIRVQILVVELWYYLLSRPKNTSCREDLGRGAAAAATSCRGRTRARLGESDALRRRRWRTGSEHAATPPARPTTTLSTSAAGGGRR